MPDREVITRVLERLADEVGDPTELVFARLFATRPDYEALFVLDTDGGVRGSMIETCVTCILDHISGGVLARNVIAAERSHHPGYGVPEDRFDDLFIAIRDVSRDVLGDRWGHTEEEAWARLLSDFATFGAEAG
ncbi:globin [bacterium]|nr:globin [bacterium]